MTGQKGAAMSRAVAVPEFDEQGELIIPPTVVENSSKLVAQRYRIVRFRGRAMLMQDAPYPHFVPLHKDRFEEITYPLLGGVTRSRVGDIFQFLVNVAEDLTDNDRYVLFGLTEADDDGHAKNLSKGAVTTVWDMDELQTVPVAPTQCVWRSPYAKIGSGGKKAPVEFIMQLAGGDPGIYDDIMQSLAPLIMTRKPDGVIWWVGDGANGKSTLMDAIYKIFPGQLSSITVKRLTDGRDTPSLNGTLANVVKESSEGRIDDTEIYKAIGTHEDFRVHKFHSQDDMLIRGNLHHIFSGNSIPSFNDKGFSARRRTFIIPFGERFESDPTFEEKNFTPEMFGRLIMEMCVYANRIKAQGYRYKWSAATLAAKADYDTEANSAEEYCKVMIDEGVVAFESFGPVRADYEQWCSENGYVPLGIGNLRRAVQSLGFVRMSTNDPAMGPKYYRLPTIKHSELQSMGMGKQGMYTTVGFQKVEPVEAPAVPDFHEPAEKPAVKPKVKLKGEDRW